jgi:hypothetical protein
MGFAGNISRNIREYEIILLAVLISFGVISLVMTIVICVVKKKKVTIE